MSTTLRSFEYLICNSQNGKITFLNGKYLGRVMGDQNVLEVRERMFDSCPEQFEFLNRLGAEGWEMVNAYHVATEHGHFDTFVFKRPK